MRFFVGVLVLFSMAAVVPVAGVAIATRMHDFHGFGVIVAQSFGGVAMVTGAVLAALSFLWCLWAYLASARIFGTIWLVLGVCFSAAATSLVAIPLTAHHRTECDTAPGGDLRVASFNALTSLADVEQLRSWAMELQPDVLVLIEVDQEFLEDFMAGSVGQTFAHRTALPGKATYQSTVVFARRDIAYVDVKARPELAASRLSPMVTLDVGGREVVLRSVHTYAPVRGNSERWWRTVGEAGQWMQRVDQPVLLVGDLNASTWHPRLRDGIAGFDDATANPWWGSVATWPHVTPGERLQAIPFAGIDHIVAKQFQVKEAGKQVISGSDHLAVWADLAVCTTGAQPSDA